MADFLIVAVVMAALFGVVFSFLYFSARARRDLHVTLRQAMERGDPLSPEMLERLAKPRDADLRRGIVAVAVGIATALFGPILGEPDAVGPLVGIAMFPITIGIAYLFLWKRSANP